MRPASIISGNHRILIVDDNSAIHDDLRKILIGEPEENSDLLSDEKILFDLPKPNAVATRFEIDSAYQGEEGLRLVEGKLVEGSPYALAFVDVRMPPGWDGVETINRLWQVDPNLQIVICTAYSDYSWKDIRARLGHSDSLLILKKPFDTIEVIQLAHALTRKWLVSHQARARLEDLDLMVAQRTAELQATNESLEKEFAERAKAEEAFRVVFEASPIGIALLDENSRFVNANNAMLQLHGFVGDRVIGNDPLELEWFNTHEELTRVLGAGLGHRGIDQHQVKLKHANLGARDGLLWARHVEIRGLRHFLCFLLDITERKQMEEDLRRARIDAEAAARTKSEFLANMSHEIRTPLNGVLGLSSFLEDQMQPESVRDVGRLIRVSGEVLRRVLDDVLDFSKIESGKLELEKQPFCLRESLDWCVGIYRAAAWEKQLELKLNVEDAVPNHVVGDAIRFRQVLTNLISNAVKFTESGCIQISVGVEEPCGKDACRLRVAVSDTGVGIPADRIDRLFESFSQVDASINRRFGGTGLGLAICKRLLELMGGDITVNSSPGTGTNFIFSLPVKVAEPEISGGAMIGGVTYSKRVLVVEDNGINRIVIQRALEKLGHRVEMVTDGRAAIQRVQETSYDLLLMDVNMPVLDGLEATRCIRNLPLVQARVPIIALTASAMANDRRDCLDAGMDDFLSKPINMEALSAVINRWTSVASAPQGNQPEESSSELAAL